MIDPAGITERAARRSVQQFGELVRGNAVKRAPVKEGTLRDSAQVSPPVLTGMGYMVTVSFDTPYARVQHDGMAARTIEPRGKQALYWPGADHPVKRVRHPGIKGKHYLSNAVKELAPKFSEIVAANVAREVGGNR